MGGFLNIVFLFSRDAGILFTIFEEPMQFFSGVRIPILAFPIWGKAIAYLFPLTYVLDIFRDLVLNGKGFTQMVGQYSLLFSIILILAAASVLLLKRQKPMLRIQEIWSFIKDNNHASAFHVKHRGYFLENSLH
ncbi:hypothetical protein AAHB53_15070 [Niallia circulans]